MAEKTTLEQLFGEITSLREQVNTLSGSSASNPEDPSMANPRQHHHHHHKDCQKLLLEILSDIREIKRELGLDRPTHIHSHFEGVPMPVSLTVGQTVIETISESNAAGPVPVVGADITVVSSDPAVATVVDNGDGTATWTAVAVGTTTSTYSDTVFGLSGTDTVTVTAAIPVPTEIESTFGTPA